MKSNQAYFIKKPWYSFRYSLIEASSGRVMGSISILDNPNARADMESWCVARNNLHNRELDQKR